MTSALGHFHVFEKERQEQPTPDATTTTPSSPTALSLTDDIVL